MNAIPSRKPQGLDKTSSDLRAAACDLGEAISWLTGGVPCSGKDVVRVIASLRKTQSFLVDEAKEQEGREAVFDGVVELAKSDREASELLHSIPHQQQQKTAEEICRRRFLTIYCDQKCPTVREALDLYNERFPCARISYSDACSIVREEGRHETA